MVATRARRRVPAAGRMQAAGSKLALVILHSPLRFLLDPGICELSYTGRRSSRRITLPVIYARSRSTVVILCGASDTKTWWRNFLEPQPVRLRIRGHVFTGAAVVVWPGSSQFHLAWSVYHQRFGDLSYERGDRLIHVNLDGDHHVQ